MDAEIVRTYMAEVYGMIDPADPTPSPPPQGTLRRMCGRDLDRREDGQWGGSATRILLSLGNVQEEEGRGAAPPFLGSRRRRVGRGVNLSVR